jgi:hypothetical protein
VIIMAAKSGGRPSKWVRDGGRIRTARGHQLFLGVTNFLKTCGLAQGDDGAVRHAILEIRADPRFSSEGIESLRKGFYTAAKASPPATEPRDQWESELRNYGAGPEASRALVDRLIAIVTLRLPYLGLGYITLMFDHVKRVRRLRTGQGKIKWLERATTKLESDKPSYPIRPWDEGSNVNIQAIKSALRDGLTAVQNIAAVTGIKPRTAQEILAFMTITGDAVRRRHGHYGPPQEGAAAYTAPGKLILKALKVGPATAEQLRERTRLSAVQLAGALHWLWRKAGKIERLKPDLYALPGAAPVPHIYAHDAVVLALDSGKKSMPELVEITGKNRAELWAALRRRLFPDGIAKRAGFRNGDDVRPGFRGRVAVFALTAKGRRRTRGSQTDECPWRRTRPLFDDARRSPKTSG